MSWNCPPQPVSIGQAREYEPGQVGVWQALRDHYGDMGTCTRRNLVNVNVAPAVNSRQTASVPEIFHAIQWGNRGSVVEGLLYPQLGVSWAVYALRVGW